MRLPVRVLLADDHGLVRTGVRTLLAQSSDFIVVGEAVDGHEALRCARTLEPDVVLMDIAMPGLNGIDAATHITRLVPAPKVIMLSMHASEPFVREALQAGASGYILKSAPIEELESAIRRVVRGERVLSAALPPQVASALLARKPAVKLTVRQREVLQLIAEGLSSRDIAVRLHLSLKTVESHRTNIAQRLDIHEVAGLTRYAIQAGLIDVSA